MRRVIVVGAGGHGQVVADALLAARKNGSPQEPIGFVDDDPALVGSAVLGLPVLGTVYQIRRFEHEGVIVAVGDNQARRKLCELLRRGGTRLANVVHPSAVVGNDVQLGVGVLVCAGAVVGTGSRVGDGAILNTGCTVDHHNTIGNYAHIAPGVHLGGEVRVGEGTLVGIGSAVIPGRTIGEWCIVGAGAVVSEDIPAHCTAVGVPARVIKRHRPDLATEV